MVAGNFGQGKIIAAPTMVKEIGLTINQKRNIETLVDQLESKYNLSSSEKTVLSLLRVVLTKQLPEIADVSEGLEKALTESELAALVVNITDVLPAGALGLAPSDFGIALDILGFVIENQ